MKREVPFGDPIEVTEAVAGRSFYVENSGRTPVYIDLAAAAPANPARDDGFELLPGNTWNRRVREQDWRKRGYRDVDVPSGQKLFAWTYEFDGVLKISEIT